MSETRTQRKIEQPDLLYVTTAVTDRELVDATADILPMVVERNVKQLVANQLPEIEKFVMDTIFDAANRTYMRRFIEKAIKDSVKEVVREMMEGE
jgi:hypothetical protein